MAIKNPSAQNAARARWKRTPVNVRSQLAVQRMTTAFSKKGFITTREKAKALFNTDKTEAEIARELCVSRQAIHRLKIQLMPERELYGQASDLRSRISLMGAQAKWAKIPVGERFRGKTKETYELIKDLLENGVAPDYISPSVILNLRPNSGLTIYIVERLLAILRKRGILKKISLEVRSRIAQESKKRSDAKGPKEENIAIKLLREEFNADKTINFDLFFKTLRALLTERTASKIPPKLSNKKYKIDVDDVAVVAHKTTELLDTLRTRNPSNYDKIRVALTQTNFWNIYINDCRRILSFASERTNLKPVSYVARKLKELQAKELS